MNTISSWFITRCLNLLMKMRTPYFLLDCYDSVFHHSGFMLRYDWPSISSKTIIFSHQVHAILKALPANTQNEKRELDNDAVKEQEPEKEATDKTDDTKDKKTTAETTKEK